MEETRKVSNETYDYYYFKVIFYNMAVMCSKNKNAYLLNHLRQITIH